MLAQASFYFSTPDDQQRLAAIREGDDLADTIADARALAQLIGPRRELILDPSFETTSPDEALELADKVEMARARRSATSAVSPEGQKMRRVRDCTVARLDALQSEIRFSPIAVRDGDLLRVSGPAASRQISPEPCSGSFASSNR